MSLTWSIVLATDKREHVLPRALRLAAGQSRPPLEIIVINASPNWRNMHALVSRKVAPAFPQIRWIYEQAHCASSAAQRSQGVAHSAADLISLLEPFENILHRYACLEDSNMSYRASRHGLLLNCLDAKICHLATHGGRLPPFGVAMNPVVFHAIYSSDENRSRALYRKQHRRRMMFQAMKDIGAGRWSLPATRGVRTALNLVDEAIGKTEQQLRSGHPQFQREQMDRHNSA